MEFNWSKQSKPVANSTSDYIMEMSEGVDDLCIRLSKDTKEFDPKIFFKTLHRYIKNEDRLLYTNITNYVFELETDEDIGVVQTNLDSVINYIYDQKFLEDFPWKPEYKNQRNPYERTKRTVLKIWDHINLAKRQMFLFNMTDEDYERIVGEKMRQAEIKLSKDMNMQLISLVAIFTALSFIVFGGISSLDNIFLGSKEIPITKLLIIGSIWCFCIMNLVFTFMFFIAKLTGLNIKSTEDVNTNLVQKYPLIWWSNLVIIAILTFSCWSYYIKSEGFSKDAYAFLNKNPTLYFGGGTISLLVLIICIGYKIYKLSKIEPED